MSGGWDDVVRPPPPATPRAPVEAIGACATHVDRPSLGACARCGTFVCAECARTSRTGAVLCAPCELRDHDVVPWEDPEVFVVAGFFETVFAIVVRPHRFFGRLPTGSWWRPAAFAILGSFAFVLPMVVMLVVHKGTVFGDGARVGPPEIVGGILGLAFVAVAFAVASAMGPALYALPLHAAARGLGGKADFRETVRAVLYATTAFWPWPLLIAFSKTLPEAVMGFVAIVLLAGMPLAGSVGLAFHLAGRHGLRPTIAWTLAIGLAVASNLGCCTIFGVVAVLTDA